MILFARWRWFIIHVAIRFVRFLFRYADDGGQRVVIVEIHDPDTLRVAANDRNVAAPHPLQFSAAGHHDDLVIIIHTHDIDDRPVTVGRFDVTEPFPASTLGPVPGGGRGVIVRFLDAAGPERGPFAVAVFTDRQQGSFRLDNHHADQLVAAGQFDTLDAAGIATHRPCVRFVESDGHAGGCGKDDFIARFGNDDIHQFVVIAQLDGNDASFFRPAVFVQRGLFDQAIPRGHQQEVAGQIEISHCATVGDFFIGVQVQQIDDRPAHAPLALTAAARRLFANRLCLCS